MWQPRLLLVALLSGVCAACGSGQAGETIDGAPAISDEDDDGIADEDEGKATLVDTDGDGTPDYLDPDSDGDGIPDYREAGDQHPETPPYDSDLDGTPDFRDLDSDGNGRLDSIEGSDDLDFDDVGNYADLDDDGDGLKDTDELGPDPLAPIDSDSDGLADFQEVDSDADTIGDSTEGMTDSDLDGLPSFRDTDSDGDCIPDAAEAGDTDLATPPLDSDSDGRPEFLSRDSDLDGLADGAEDANCNGVQDPGESSARDGDGDGDGVSDLIESVAGTDPTNPGDNPQANGDFYFMIPYQEATTPPIDTLEFRTSIQYADIYFSFDITGSMSEELTAMVTNVPSLIDELRCAPTGGACVLDEDCAVGVCFDGVCIEDPVPAPGCVPNMWTGVGIWNNLDTFSNLVSLQADAAVTANAIPGTGSGSAEAPLQAPACVADDQYCTNDNQSCANTGVGCVGFRENAIRILIQITDADDQCSGTRCALFTAATTGAILIDKGIKFVSLYGTGDSGGTGTPASVAADLGIASNSVNSSGVPFTYLAVDAAVVANAKQGVLDLVRGVPLNVTIGAADLPGDAGDALQFVNYLEVNVSGGDCTTVSPTADTDSDTFHDAFPSLLPGTPVCWDVHPIGMNTTVPATEEPQIFTAELTVYGDGSPLDSRQVYFLVPPVISQIPID